MLKRSLWLGLISLCYIAGCAQLPANDNLAQTFVLQDVSDTKLNQAVAEQVANHPGKSGVTMLIDGIDAFIARVALVQAAQVSLDLQYYIWKNDLTGRLLVSQLLDAADRGVRVRILLDDLDTSGKAQGLHLLDMHPNIEIRFYNVFAHRRFRAFDFVTDLDRVNNRMHNKSFTADNAFTIVGGRNIGNEYFGAQSHAEFRDLDVLAAGEVVSEVSNVFDTYWNSHLVWPSSVFLGEQAFTEQEYQQARAHFQRQTKQDKNNPYLEAVEQVVLDAQFNQRMQNLRWVKADIYADAPDKALQDAITSESHIAPLIGKLYQSATQELMIVSPYFVPNDALVELFADLTKRGVVVKIITNSLASNDVSIVHAGYINYRKPLLQAGVQLYEFKPTLNEEYVDSRKWYGSSHLSLHSKVFITDKQQVFVGSFNLDPRSVLHNTEMGMLIHSAAIGISLVEAIEQHIDRLSYQVKLDQQGDLIWQTTEAGEQVVLTKEPYTSWWQRVKLTVQSWLVIESYL
ncbi:phospholipase D family protein [Motilimonas eburnea]|uniref:phospholipase D family protein n=1 Tax=Motilimonas eburnea TaxID=1737488 RepID=UPI001E53D741|nr:phospholipase D family protein [Motilimonas eburnea]MCE2573239.1 phospholipase D family protein [Motilimonas eburnea]